MILRTGRDASRPRRRPDCPGLGASPKMVRIGRPAPLRPPHGGPPLEPSDADLPMYRVTREIDFCYGHRLIRYSGKCRHLHGHNGRVLITVEAPELDERGMLIDFVDIKQSVQAWIDEHLDHNLLLCQDDPLLPLLLERGERVFVMAENPTAENIARLIFDYSREAGLPVVEVTLWETPRCSARYTGPDR